MHITKTGNNICSQKKKKYISIYANHFTAGLKSNWKFYQTNHRL